MKKILLLGGISYLIPLIKCAKQMGHYVITCDYLPHNIAHQYSDEYHSISIIDKEAVLLLAKSLEINGIISFAVDPGVTTAVYVSNKLGLPSPGSLKSIQILQNKELFRAFLTKHNFNVPRYKSFTNKRHALDYFKEEDFPLIVKPVDSAGSKGVTKVTCYNELNAAIEKALQFSLSKKVIVEDFIESNGLVSDSDCFSINGQLVLTTFSSQHFSKYAPNSYTPSAYMWPTNISIEIQNHLKNELQRLINLLELETTLFNIEIRVDTNQIPFIMEVSPRGGGNRISEIINYATGVDLIRAAIQASLGEHIDHIPKQLVYNSYWAEIILYSHIDGRFKELYVADYIKQYIFEIDLWVEYGDTIGAFHSANYALGSVILKCEDKQKIENIVNNYYDYINIKLI